MTHIDTLPVLYRVVDAADEGYDVLMRNESGSWSCVDHKKSKERAVRIAEKFRAAEAKGAK